MMKKFFPLFLLLTSLTIYSQDLKNSQEYKCATPLTKSEFYKFQYNTFNDYKDKDLDLLADITTFIIDSNPEKEAYECFFNKREKNLLVLDVLGLENEASIDKTICALIENKEIKLPKNTIILFHRYVNGFDDGGIIVALKFNK